MLVQQMELEKALKLEQKGQLIIFDAGVHQDLDYHPQAKQWKDNFDQLRTKARHVPPNKIPQHFNAFISICIPSTSQVPGGTTQYHWKYLRGLPTDTFNQTQVNCSQDLEYVYVLTNPEYTSLVKIGMTRKDPAKRLEQINGTGTVHCWELKFALPVKLDSAFKIEQQVHKYFQDKRYHAKRLNDREMFEVDCFTAIDRIREVGELFRAGTPILY